MWKAQMKCRTEGMIGKSKVLKNLVVTRTEKSNLAAIPRTNTSHSKIREDKASSMLINANVQWKNYVKVIIQNIVNNIRRV